MQENYRSAELIKLYRETKLWTEDTYIDLLERKVKRNPDGEIIDEKERITYYEFLNRVESFATCLVERGYQKGDRIGVHLPNWIEFLIAVSGAMKVGVVPTFIHLAYRATEVEYVLNITAAKGVVIPGLYKDFNFPAMYEGLRGQVPELKDIFVLGDEVPNGAVSFCKSISRSVSIEDQKLMEVHRPSANDIMLIMLTSGTTGKSKAVVHQYKTLLTSYRSLAQNCQVQADSKSLILSPMTHAHGFGVGILTAMLYGGDTIILNRWQVEEALETIAREKVNYVIGVPTHLVDIYNSDLIDKLNLTSVRTFIYAGAPCPLQVLELIQKKCGWQITTLYGWSEGGPHTCTRLDDPPEVVTSTVGRAQEGYEVRLVNNEGYDVPLGEVGEFWGRGPNLFAGYYGRQDLTQEKFTEDGWFKTGDLFGLHENGNYIFVGRMDDVINRGGQKIDPLEIESILASHPDIESSALIGLPDPRLGENPCIFVIPKPGKSIELMDIREFLTNRGVARYKLPEHIRIVETLPRTLTGKLVRYVLRNELKG